MISSRNRGFTLIELLVVIAIIAILAAILFPVFSSAKDAAKKTQCVNNAKQWGAVITMYNDNFGSLPPRCLHVVGGVETYWTTLVQPYVRNKNIRWCPSKGTLENYTYPGAAGRMYPISEQWKGRYMHYGMNVMVGVSMQPAQGPQYDSPPMKTSTFTCPSKLILLGESANGAADAYAYKGLTGCQNPNDGRWGFNLIYPDNFTKSGETSPEVWTDVNRHGGGFNVLYADMHVALAKKQDVYPSTQNPRAWFPRGIVPAGL